ncbi:MAG TPA: hypothetical protein VHI98_06655 [Vicinamibacterales bacterium]|nr:hypothetical protein [Vicinamibacterales bacterium]
MMAVRKRMWIAAAIGAFGLGLPLTPAGEALADSSKLFLVKVMNGAGNPVPVGDVDQPARQIFRESLSCAVAQGQIDCMNQLSVPAGKLLVIETISATLNVPGGQQPSLSVVVGSTPEFGFLVPLVRTASFTSPLATTFTAGWHRYAFTSPWASTFGFSSCEISRPQAEAPR